MENRVKERMSRKQCCGYALISMLQPPGPPPHSSGPASSAGPTSGCSTLLPAIHMESRVKEKECLESSVVDPHWILAVLNPDAYWE